MDITAQLIRDEGYVRRAYLDTKGKVTVGVGFNLTDVDVPDVVINYWLSYKINEVTNTLQTRLPYYNNLDNIRQAVLVNMCFNLGFDKLETFVNFLSAVAHGEFDDAADHMLDSLWAKQVGQRANRLADQMRTGQWQ